MSIGRSFATAGTGRASFPYLPEGIHTIALGSMVMS
jgi:hypothetical protein